MPIANSDNTRKAEDKLREYLSKNYVYLIGKLREDLPADQEITLTGQEFKSERYGNPLSKFWKGKYSFRRGGADATTPEETAKFYLEYFNGENEGNDRKDLMDLKFAMYSLFADTGMTPKPHKMRWMPKALLLSSTGDTMLEEKLLELPLEERDTLNQTSGDLLFKFHLAAENVWSTILSTDSNVLESVRYRAKRPTIDKSLECFASFKKNKGEDLSSKTKRRFVELYSPIAQIYDENKTCLVHGDAGAQNIVGPEGEEIWTSENMGLVDLENLGLGHPMFDEAKRSTSNSMRLNPGQWNKVIVNYIKNSAGRFIKKVEEGGFLKKATALNNKTMGSANTLFYAGAVNESLIRIGFMHRFENESPAKYDVWLCDRPILRNTDVEMGRNIKLALDYVLENRKEFILEEDNQGKGKFKDLRKFFVEEGLVPEKAEEVKY